MPGPKVQEAAVSQDPQLSKLLNELTDGADVAIAASAFRTLMTTLPSSDDDTSWELPVTVRLIQPADGPDSKVVYVDKPLVARAATLRRKHEVVYKAVLTSVCTASAASSIAQGNPTTVDSSVNHAARPPGGEASGAAQGEQNSVLRGDVRPASANADVEHTEQRAAQHEPAQPVGEPPQRGVRYDLWRIGKFRVVVRSHAVAQTIETMQRGTHPEQAGSAARWQGLPVIARAKIEYHARDGMEQVGSC